jgi:hypothetical protein
MGAGERYEESASVVWHANVKTRRASKMANRFWFMVL